MPATQRVGLPVSSLRAGVALHPPEDCTEAPGSSALRKQGRGAPFGGAAACLLAPAVGHSCRHLPPLQSVSSSRLLLHLLPPPPHLHKAERASAVRFLVDAGPVLPKMPPTAVPSSRCSAVAASVIRASRMQSAPDCCRSPCCSAVSAYHSRLTRALEQANTRFFWYTSSSAGQGALCSRAGRWRVMLRVAGGRAALKCTPPAPSPGL